MAAVPQDDHDAFFAQALDGALEALATPLGSAASMEPVFAALTLLQDLASTAAPSDEARRALWRAMALADLRSLTFCHASTDGATMRQGELGGLAALRCALACDGGSALSCTQLWRGTADVTKDRRAIGTYTAAEVLRALHVLRGELTEAVFDVGLYQYCVALEHRVAELLFFGHSAATWDAIAFCVEVDAMPGTYRASQTFLDTVWTAFRGIYAKIVRCGPLQAQPAPAPPDDAEAAALARLWTLLRQTAAAIGSDEVSSVLRTTYVAQKLRPGDRELHSLAHHGITPNADGIMQATCDPARLSAALAGAALSVGRAIEKAGERHVPGAPEPQLLSLALFDTVCIATSMSACGFGVMFGRPETAVQADYDSVWRISHRRPMVVQMFNHWQLLHAGQMQRCDSLLRALYHWATTVCSLHDARGDDDDTMDAVSAVMLDRGFYARLMAAALPGRIVDEPAPPPPPPASTDRAAAAAPAPVVIEFD